MVCGYCNVRYVAVDPWEIEVDWRQRGLWIWTAGAKRKSPLPVWVGQFRDLWWPHTS